MTPWTIHTTTPHTTPAGFAWWRRGLEFRLASEADPEVSVLGGYSITASGWVDRAHPVSPPMDPSEGSAYRVRCAILKHWGFL